MRRPAWGWGWFCAWLHGPQPRCRHSTTCKPGGLCTRLNGVFELQQLDLVRLRWVEEKDLRSWWLDEGQGSGAGGMSSAKHERGRGPSLEREWGGAKAPADAGTAEGEEAGVGAAPPAKRRGRPPKARPAAEGAGGEAAQHEQPGALSKKRGLPDEGPDHTEAPPAKRRGRPPKARPDVQQQEAQQAAAPAAAEAGGAGVHRPAEASPPPAPVGQGAPATSNKLQPVGSAPPAKKRGRPPKARPAPEPGGQGGAAAAAPSPREQPQAEQQQQQPRSAEPAPAKQRGRPPKGRPAAHAAEAAAGTEGQ